MFHRTGNVPQRDIRKYFLPRSVVTAVCIMLWINSEVIDYFMPAKLMWVIDCIHPFLAYESGIRIILPKIYLKCRVLQYGITQAPLFRRGADSSLVMNIHALCDAIIRIQTAWRHNANACCHNRSSLAAVPSATPWPCRVSLNGMFHQDSATQWIQLRIYFKNM